MASEEPLINLGSSSEEKGDDLGKLKKSLEPYRELIIPIKKVLEWEQNYYPAIIVAVITLKFLLIWYIEPSVLTSICLTGIVVCTLDFALPPLTGLLFSSSDWDNARDEQYDSVCRRLLHAKQHFLSIVNYMVTTKQEKPKLYMAGMMGMFACLAWFGSIIDNLLLTYLIVTGLALCPGVRKCGVLDKVCKQATDKISELKKSKSKTN